MAVIQDIAVDEKSRGKGIGSKLIKCLIEKLRKDNINRIKLWVHWTDARAIPFYYKYGFRMKRIMRTRKMKDVPDGEDIIILEKNL